MMHRNRAMTASMILFGANFVFSFVTVPPNARIDSASPICQRHDFVLYANMRGRPDLAKRMREDEIRRKIKNLKKSGKIRSADESGAVKESVSSADGGAKEAAKLLGKLASKGSGAAAEYEAKIMAKLSAMDDDDDENDNEAEVFDEDEEDLEALVQQALLKKRNKQREAIMDGSLGRAESKASIESNANVTVVNGTQALDPDVEMHQPTKSGSWGVFPRPKSISKTYGGGKRIGVGFTKDPDYDEGLEKTRKALKEYKEKFGIDVKSEKEHADEIAEAQEVAAKYMARGIYNKAVTTLERVTQWCSSNSPIGGRVFLELGMAYEACGRSSEAATVYNILAGSRMDDVKKDAKRLLYGMEAMDIMRNELKLSGFQRKKIRDDYIDVSSFARIDDYDTKTYNTAWVDTSKNGWFYKSLTESVVRSTREARQILFAATYSECNIPRPRVVQALRSISREFDSDVKREQEEKEDPTVYIDGKAIVKKREKIMREPGSFKLLSGEQMLENLDGEWRLQLLADKTGDGVRYFNTTTAWQRMDCSEMKYSLFVPLGWSANIDQEEEQWEFDIETRTIDRLDGSSRGGWVVSALGGSTTVKPQQVMCVDDEMCVMRLRTDIKTKNSDTNIKDYFSVWRKVDIGTFSN
mmetsp:Transcript_11448/g.17235  ORF Transcript_11448/g.17235 Transcript_11448/m.17235 type:complete len:640 (+) Transcript_11448:151-2070(+)